jgi:hypothetical protein
MSHVTTCPVCGDCYQESSEEAANDPSRLCWPCWHAENRGAPRRTAADRDLANRQACDRYAAALKRGAFA